MTPRLLGIETEYGLAAVDARGRRRPQPQALDALVRRARAALPYLPDGRSAGMFLGNGARFYVDCGGHPEMTTPECADPWDAVRYVRAGEALLDRVAGDDTAVFRTNVDYSGSRTTWGCHESYLHTTDPSGLPAQLIPHLVSRIVYTGAGGFNNVSAGLEFMLSPRATHIGTDVSADSTGYRGIFHTKNEPLCGGGYNRLHVIFGETLCSDLATWLKVGTTALVVAMCDAGLHPAEGMTLAAPVVALHAFAADPSCRVRTYTVRGPRVSALDVQRHYLAQAERHAGAATMPSWAPEVRRIWRDTLDRVELGWEAASTSLDWAIKLGLYRDRAKRLGFTWENVGAWNEVVRHLSIAMGRASLPLHALTAKLVDDPESPIAATVAALSARLGTLGLSWRDFPAFLAMRDQLFEIDTRFGQLGSRGIFTSLDDAGVLTHRLVDRDEIARATTTPPMVGRARVRGLLVRHLAGNGTRYQCDWEGISDVEGRKHVDLTDPFATTATWTPWPTQGRRSLPPFLTRDATADESAPSAASATDPVRLSMRALTFRKRGQLDEAERLLRRAIELEDAQVPADSPKRSHRRNNLALVLLRADRLREACDVNAEAWGLKTGQHDVTSGRILVVRVALRLLLGLTDVGLFVGQLKTLLAFESLGCLGDVTPTWDVDDVLDALDARLGPDDCAMLRAVVAALDGSEASTLETVPEWRAAAPTPLDAPWEGDETRASASG